MTAKERLEVIRAKAGRTAGFAPAKPRRKERYYVPLGSARGFYYNFMGELRPDRLHPATGWLKAPDGVKAKPLATKRTARVHHLTRISQQLPMKLPELLYSSIRPGKQ